MSDDIFPVSKPVHIVSQRVASYFKVPYRQLRATLNTKHAQANIASFGLLEEAEVNFNDRFYCQESKPYKLVSLWDEPKFLKTQFYQDFLHYLTVQEETGCKWALCIGGPNVMVITALTRPPVLNRDQSAIFIGHANEGKGILIEPIKNYLSARYPLPQV